MSWFFEYKQNGRLFIIPSVSLKNESPEPPIFEVYPDFKDAFVEFLDKNIGDLKISTVHQYVNKCLKVIMEHDSIFLDKYNENDSDSDSDGSDDEMLMRREKMLDSNISLSNRFADIAEEMSEKEKEKRKRNLIIKGLVKSHHSATEYSLDSNKHLERKGFEESSDGDSVTFHNQPKSLSQRFLNLKETHCVSESTTYRWMCAVGYKYSEQHKCFYVDAHERPDVVRYRIKFVHRYLNEYEPYMLRWIQVPIGKLKEIFGSRTMLFDTSEFGATIKKKEETLIFDALMTRGLTYTNDSGDKFIEFHVDSIADDVFSDLHYLVDELEKVNDGMGYNQSHFRPDKERKVLIAIGQDECIFKQFLLHRKAWQSNSDKFRIRPKDDGSGMMVSAFQGREFGFGFSSFDKYKEKINAF